MKRIIAVSLLISMISLMSFPQGSFEYTVEVTGGSGKGLKVWLKEINTGQIIRQYTDNQGKTVFYPPPGYWSLNLEGLLHYKEFEIQEGVSGHGLVSVYYDHAEIMAEKEISNKRQQMVLTRINQNRKLPALPPSDSVILKVKLLNASNRPVPEIPVDVVSVGYGFIMENKTTRTGLAEFMLPLGDRYAIDVDGVKNYSVTRMLNRQGVVTITLDYEPTLITENVCNDTVTQIITPNTAATSARSLFRLKVWQEEGGELVNDWVYLHEIGSDRVFKASTDKSGIATFLIPNGSKYLLHFDYARDVDVYNFKTVRGRGTSEGEIIYRPDPRLKYPEQYLPTPEELFITEFQNFMTKQLPEPEGKAGLFSGWGNNAVNAATKYAVLDIGLSVTSDTGKIGKTTPVNLCFVIDKSGSMAGYHRIESLKESMVKFIDKMRPYDKVALVTFNSNAFLDISLEELGNRKKMKDHISEIEPEGWTNIYNGLVVGYEELLANFDNKRLNRLMLLTDGYGETKPSVTVNKSKEYNAKGISISAIGVGNDYNAALLTLLTNESGGLMEHAGLSGDIYTAFERQLSDLIFPVGREAKLTIRYNNMIRFKHLFGLPLSSDKNNVAVFDIGNLFAGQNKISLARFELDRPTKEIEQMPVYIELSWYDLLEERYVTYTQEARLTWMDDDPKIDLFLDQEKKKLYAIAIINQSLKVMADAFGEENIPKAKHALDSAFDQIKELYPGAADEDVDKLVAQMHNYSKGLENVEKKRRQEEKKNNGF